MNRNKISEIKYQCEQISEIENKSYKLHKLKDEIVSILKGYTNIPESKIYSVFKGIDNLDEYLKKDIERVYNKINDKINE